MFLHNLWTVVVILFENFELGSSIQDKLYIYSGLEGPLSPSIQEHKMVIIIQHWRKRGNLVIAPVIRLYSTK